MKISPEALRKWYRKQEGNFYGRQKYKIACRYDDDELQILQKKFAIKLTGHWMRGDELIFIDESGVNKWRHNNMKTWMLKHKPFYLRLAPSRGSGISV